MKLKEYLLLNRKEKNIRLFFDIETLQYNEDQGRLKPTLYKNVTYSVAISFFHDHEIYVEVFPNFKMFFDTVTQTYSKWKTLPNIELIAHNNNKYDNHFLRHDLLYYYPGIKVDNLYLKNATEEGNALSVKTKEVTKEDKQGLILEKRIKSSNNLELDFYLNHVHFFTTDNYMKTNVSIATLGKKLLRLNVITEEELKTDFNYTEFNKDYDMTEQEAHEYALDVFDQLTENHMTYIKNDVIILGKSVYYYSDLFNGFDYNKITFTSNILEFYNDNNLTNYQLLKKVGQGKDEIHVKYTDYRFANINFYDYLKSFYSGGLNFYNDRYIGQIIQEKMFSIDINSSYPYVMHNFKVPTFLLDYEAYENETIIDISLSHDTYTLYRMTKQRFDYEVIDQIDSYVLRKILVKYYNKNDFININSYTLRMIKNLTGIDIQQLTVTSWVRFECEYFGSRDKIQEKYYVKTQGKFDKKINMQDPYHITITDQDNDVLFSQEEVDNSKVVLNGLYGIPALRATFNLFRLSGDVLYNVPNGYINNERNIVFSTFVTSVSLYNLLSPLAYLTQQEMDHNLIYTDTDSLYLKSTIRHKLSHQLFDSLALGYWDIQDDQINQFFVLNHKKYAYEAYNSKTGDYDIKVKCGGVPQEAFNRNVPFQEFVNHQFSEGVTITNNKSIINDQGTISIYPSETDLDQGKGYPLFSYNEHFKEEKENMFQQIREETGGNQEDMLYIESSLGTFSMSELYPFTNEIKQKLPLIYLEVAEDQIKELLQHDQ